MTGGPLRRLQLPAAGLRSKPAAPRGRRKRRIRRAACQSAIDTRTMTAGPLRRLQLPAAGLRTKPAPLRGRRKRRIRRAACQSAMR